MLPVGSTSLSLSGMTALVIGGSSGIGESVAHGFAREGARVAIAARTGLGNDEAVMRLVRGADAGETDFECHDGVLRSESCVEKLRTTPPAPPGVKP